MIDLVRAHPYVRMHRDKVFVVKIGGACIARPAGVRRIAQQIAILHACGALPIVVHGGGPQTDELQRSLGEEPRMVDGRRVTSPTALRALRMSTAGELNSTLAAAITAEGASAVGLCAGTGDLVVARRRPPVETTEGIVDFGQVGDVASVDPGPLLSLLDSDVVPVVCPPASDGKGGFLNVNADSTAAAIAAAIEADKLVLATSAGGVLTDPSDPTSVISTLSLLELNELEQAGKLVKGMKVKAAAIRSAIASGVERVHVVSGLEPEGILGELYTTHGTGTLVTLEAESAPEEELDDEGLILEPEPRARVES